MHSLKHIHQKKRRKGGSKIKKEEEEKSKSENQWEDEGKDNKEEKEGRDEEATQIERHRFSGHVQLEFRVYRSLIAFTYMINCGLWHHHEPELDVGLIICLSLSVLLRERLYQSILVALNSSPRSFQVLYFPSCRRGNWRFLLRRPSRSARVPCICFRLISLRWSRRYSRFYERDVYFLAFLRSCNS